MTMIPSLCAAKEAIRTTVSQEGQYDASRGAE